FDEQAAADQAQHRRCQVVRLGGLTCALGLEDETGLDLLAIGSWNGKPARSQVLCRGAAP
nr:hypothetical protein [Gemmatimonadaceae bacterium]